MVSPIRVVEMGFIPENVVERGIEAGICVVDREKVVIVLENIATALLEVVEIGGEVEYVERGTEDRNCI